MGTTTRPSVASLLADAPITKSDATRLTEQDWADIREARDRGVALTEISRRLKAAGLSVTAESLSKRLLPK